MKKPTAISALLFLVLVFAGWRIYFSAYGLPILLGDAVFFAPTALQYSLFGDFSNPWWNPIHQGGGPFTWHGWLYPYVLSKIGSLLSMRTTTGIKVIESVLIALSALIFAYRIVLIPVSNWAKAAGIVCVCCLVSLASGRPEVIAQLLLAIWLAVYPKQSDAKSDLVTAAILAAIAVAQPTVAMLSAFFFSAYRTYASDTRLALLSIVRVGIVSIALTLAMTAAFYPWSISAWANGLMAHSAWIVKRTDGDFWLVYFTSPWHPLLIVWWALPAATGTLLLARGRIDKPQSVLFYPLFLVSIYLSWRFGMRVSYTAYNVSVFFPLVVYGLLLVCGDGRLRQAEVLVKVVMSFMAMLLVCVQLRAFALMELSHRDGIPASVVAQDIRADLQAGRKVAATINLAMADYVLVNHKGLIIMGAPDVEEAGDAQVMYLHQAATGKNQPAAIAGWTMQGNHFMNGVSIAGVKVANTPQSYDYARYVRSTAE